MVTNPIGEDPKPARGGILPPRRDPDSIPVWLSDGYIIRAADAARLGLDSDALKRLNNLDGPA